jgi:hypothetical protein
MGAFLRCDDYENFFPNDLKTGLLNNIENTFHLKEHWPEFKETEFIHQVYHTDRLFLLSDCGGANNKKGSFSQYEKSFRSHLSKNPEFARLQLDTFSTQGIPRADPLGANLRLLMEGRGINVNNWYLDLTQPTYRYHNGTVGAEDTIRALVKIDPTIDPSIADIFTKPGLQGFQEKYKTALCERLQSLSQKSLEGTKAPNIPPSKETSLTSLTKRGEDGPFCGPRSDASAQAKELLSVVGKCGADKYPATFKNTCAVCHDSEAKIAPRIPFSSPEAMSKWLAKDENKKLIKDKLKNTDETKRMPPTRKLSDSELTQILNFIETK